MAAPRAVICRLCMETKALSELSQSADGHLTDVCLLCCQRELRAVLAQIEAILALDDRLTHPDNHETQEISFKKFPCGHINDGTCWCSRCHYCEDVTYE